MAKKEAAKQLQVDIQTDDELDKFLENPGLCLLDIYSEWCGPCLGMVTSLRKAKLETGGESLYLAICKSDTIEALARFRNKSEPTWLFVYKYKAINIMFGSEIPKLLKLIASELHRTQTKGSFPDAVHLRELLPIEKERLAKILATTEKDRLAKEREIKKKRLDYLNYCTGEIISYTAGFGVTIFGPHINRDHLKKVLEIGDSEKLSCKDRKAIVLVPEDIEVLNYACNNPISEDALDYMYNKELLVCYWKMPDGDKRQVEDIMAKFVDKVTKAHPTEDGEGQVQPILQHLEVKVKAPKIEELEPLVPDESSAPIKGVDFAFPVADEEEEAIEEDDLIMDIGVEDMIGIESHESVVEKKSSSFLYIANVPAMWTPGNRKTTAAAIYVFFRNQTTGFLPPDPVPEPPHLLVVFDAWKRRDVTDVMNKFTEEILSYGYFTNEDPKTAKLIANSTEAYTKQPANRLDKLVVKVAKKTSHAVLALASHGPTYVSPNTDIGKIEALHFFPDGYNSDEIIEIPPPDTVSKEKHKPSVSGSQVLPPEPSAPPADEVENPAEEVELPSAEPTDAPPAELTESGAAAPPPPEVEGPPPEGIAPPPEVDAPPPPEDETPPPPEEEASPPPEEEAASPPPAE